MSPRIWIVLGALSAAMAVGLGAYHAHGLEGALEQRGLEGDVVQHKMHDFDVGVRYQMLHALAIVLVAVIAWQAPSVWFQVSAGLFLVGTALFSGSLYVNVLTGTKLPWFLVPGGGLAFIVGWIVLAIGAIAAKRQHASESK